MATVQDVSPVQHRTALESLLREATVRALHSMDDRVAAALRLVTTDWPVVSADEDTTGTTSNNGYHGLVSVYRAEAAEAEPEHAARLLEQIARLYEDVLHDRRSATKSIVEALKQFPQSDSARRTAVRLLFDLDGTELLGKLIENLASSVESLPKRHELLLDYALHEELRGGSPDRVKQTYQRVLTEDPGNPLAAEGLFRILLQQEQWSELSRLCRQMAESETDVGTRVNLLLAAALLARDASLQERASWAAQAAALYPQSRLALPMAVGMFKAAGDDDSAVRIQIEQTGQCSTDAARLHFHVSWVFAQQSDKVADALAHAERAREFDPDNMLYLSWLCELYERHCRWAELASALREKSEADITREECVESLSQLADVLSDCLDDVEGAIEVLEKALSIVPGDLACLATLGRLYVRASRWEDLAAMHLKEAETSSDDLKRAGALYRAAGILARRLGRFEEAIRHLQQALELDAALSPVVRLLDDLYRKTERYHDLVALLRRELLSAKDDGHRTSLLQRIANVLDMHLHDEVEAIAAYEQLLELQPDGETSLAALARLYESQRQYEKLLSIQRAQAMLVARPQEKATILLRMGQILEDELGNPDQALAHYREALVAHSTPEAYEHVGRLLHSAQRWSELVVLTRQELDNTEAPARRVRLLFRLGQLLERQLDDPDGAAAAYKAVVEVEPGHWPALRGITRVAHHLPNLRRQGLENMLLEKLPGRARTHAQVRVALSMLDSEPQTTREVLSQALEEEPDNLLARELLLQLLVEDANWQHVRRIVGGTEAMAVALGGLCDVPGALEAGQALAPNGSQDLCRSRWIELLQTDADPSTEAKLLQDRIQLETDTGRRNGLRWRLARMLDHQDASPEVVADLCRAILRDDPRDNRALDLLERVGRRRDDGELVMETLSHRLKYANDAQGRADLHEQCGRYCAAKGDQDQAIEHWRQALDEDPGCRPAYEDLKRLYAARDDDVGLLWVLEKGSNAVLHDEVRVRDLLRRADLYAANNAKDRAVDDLKLVLKQEPAQLNAIERLERLLGEGGDYEQLDQYLEGAIAHVGAPACKAALSVKLALICRDHLDQPRRAAELLRDAIEADPDNVAALLVAADVRRRLDQPTEAVALLNRVILRSEQPDELVGAHLALAHLYDAVAGDGERARKSLRAVLEINDEHLPALRHLADVTERDGDDERLEGYLERLLQLEPPNALQRADLLRRLALVRSRRHGIEAESLREPLTQGLELLPGDPDLVQLAVEAYSKAEQWERLVELLKRSIEQLPSQHHVRFMLVLGRALAQKLDRRQEARDVLLKVVRLDPDHEDAVELLLRHMDDADLKDPEMRSEVIALHRRLLARDPLLVSSIRCVAQLCRVDGRPDEAHCAESVLVFLGEATEEEAYFHNKRRRKLPARAKGTLGPEHLKTLAMPQGDHPVRAVLALLKPFMPELLPPDLSQYGIESLEEARIDEQHPAWRVVQDCAELLSVGKVQVAEALGGAAEGATEPGAPPTLVLPRSFARYPVPQQRFMVGRMLGRVMTDSECCDAGRAEPMDRRLVEMLLAALIRSADATFGAGVASAAILDDLVQRIKATIDHDTLKHARVAANACWEEEGARPAMDAWLRGCEIACLRVGLLCGGGLDSLAALRQRAGTELHQDVLRNVASFATSVEFARLRQQVGLAMKE